VKATVDLPAEMPKEFALEMDGQLFDVEISPKRAKTD
jgi:hypothetical protein